MGVGSQRLEYRMFTTTSEIPYPDAKVAALLCVGGPVKYLLRDNSGITDNWILTNVIPHGCRMIDEQAAVILGKALLWFSFAQEGQAGMPDPLRARIQDAYALIHNELEDGTNPVNKIPVVVTGHDGEVYIDDIPDVVDDNSGGNGNGNGNTGGGFIDRPIRDQMLAMHSQLNGLRRSDEEILQVLEQMNTQFTRHFRIMNTNIRRVAPVLRGRVFDGGNVGAGNGGNGGNHGGNNVGAGGPPAAHFAALSATPRDLHTLWQEYQVGLGGRKPARLFTAWERGRVKHKYTRRKVVWDTVDRLVRGGLTANVAIDRIYDTYGRNATVTKIINNMLSDRRNNTVPAALR